MSSLLETNIFGQILDLKWNKTALGVVSKLSCQIKLSAKQRRRIWVITEPARVNYCGILQLTSWRIFIETWHRASCCYLLLLFQQIIVQLTPDGDITYTIFKIYLTVFLFQGVTDEEPICISFR